MFMKKVLIFLICLIGYQIGCHAQMADEHYYFKNLSVQNGLSQNTVNAILQDKQGFMWFGTKDGLNRYDGLSFRKFKHDDRTRRSIGNNFITALYEDSKGDIWVGTDVGLYIYNPEKDSFRRCSCRRYAGVGCKGRPVYYQCKGRKQMIPKDPVILLSYVNTQLRDYYDSLEALCTCRGLKKQELVEKIEYPMTVQGQYDFMEDFLNRISHIKGNRGKGFFYWEPAWIPVPGSGWATEASLKYMNDKGPCGNEWANQALFDYQGNVLPTWNLIRDFKPEE
jgi:hypothetical protein